MNESLKILPITPVGILLGYGVWSLVLPEKLGVGGLLDPFTFVFFVFAVGVVVVTFAFTRADDET